MSYNDELDGGEEIDDLPINFEYEKIGKEFQCRVCLNVFSEKLEFIKHIGIHTEQFALDFIKEFQPVSGNMILKKFKNLNLVELEKKGLIKFFDEFMAWGLSDFTINEKKVKSFEYKADSIINAPCLVCPVEQKCSLEGEISPRNCQFIEDWVNGKFIPKKDTIQKSENYIETLMQAKLFCSKRKKFDIVGKFEKNKIQNSPNKFTFTDKEDYKMPVILKFEDEEKIELKENMIIKNVKLTGNPHGLVIDACKKDTKIQKI